MEKLLEKSTVECGLQGGFWGFSNYINIILSFNGITKFFL